MAYLKPGINNDGLKDLKLAIQSLDDVDNLQFISKQEALSRLKAQMEHQSSLFENLTLNPLPAFSGGFHADLNTVGQRIQGEVLKKG